jgi:hypothetical protein
MGTGNEQFAGFHAAASDESAGQDGGWLFWQAGGRIEQNVGRTGWPAVRPGAAAGEPLAGGEAEFVVRPLIAAAGDQFGLHHDR